MKNNVFQLWHRINKSIHQNKLYHGTGGFFKGDKNATAPDPALLVARMSHAHTKKQLRVPQSRKPH